MVMPRLKRHASKKLAYCALKTCRKRFTKHPPNKLYCSRDCLQRANEDRYRFTEKGRETARAYARAAYKRDPVKAAYTRSLSHAKFMGYAPPDIFLEDYRVLISTHKVCDSCGGGEGTRLCMDHDHDSGQVRGMLCRPCNITVGLMNDSVERLKKVIGYLENAETIASGEQKGEETQSSRRTSQVQTWHSSFQ